MDNLPHVVVQELEAESQSESHKHLRAESSTVKPLRYMDYTFTELEQRKAASQAISEPKLLDESVPSTSKKCPVTSLSNNILLEGEEDYIKSVLASSKIEVITLPCAPLSSYEREANKTENVRENSSDEITPDTSAKHKERASNCKSEEELAADCSQLHSDRCKPSICHKSGTELSPPVSVSTWQLISKSALAVLILTALIVASVQLSSLHLMPPVFGLSIALLAALLGFIRSVGQYIENQKFYIDCSHQAKSQPTQYKVIYRYVKTI